MQNLISLNLSAQDLADVDAAIATLRRVFAPMIVLQPAQRRELYKMGDKSESFCRQGRRLGWLHQPSMCR